MINCNEAVTTSEWCSYCEQEEEYTVTKDCYVVNCKCCGRQLFLCSLCPTDKCNHYICPAMKGKHYES